MLQADELAANISGLNPGTVGQAAAMLNNASQHTQAYYGSDVRVAYRLLQSLLQHESNQHGFGLAATQDVHFNEVGRAHAHPHACRDTRKAQLSRASRDRWLARILEHSGFTRTPHPSLQNLLRAGSAILAPETRPHWDLIQQTEGGSALLLHRYETYANTLAQNMRKTYLSPFTFSTPNIGEPGVSPPRRVGSLCCSSTICTGWHRVLLLHKKKN